MINANRLRAEIITQYGTQAAFAKAIGWHPNKVSAIITGKRIPNVDEAAKISENLQLASETVCDIFLPTSNRMVTKRAI